MVIYTTQVYKIPYSEFGGEECNLSLGVPFNDFCFFPMTLVLETPFTNVLFRGVSQKKKKKKLESIL